MKNSQKSKEFWDILDTLFVVSSEVYKGKGEDSFCCSYNENAALIGVFDGCGGLGARQYKHYEDHTGAYIASRIASGAVYEWFQLLKSGKSIDKLSVELQEKITSALLQGERMGGETLKLRGSLVRDFPTTAAIVVAGYNEGTVSIDVIWAGDSRVYLLESNGLGVLTQDDTDSRDAFDDLRNDPVQTNVISSDGNFMFHGKRVQLNKPTIVFTSTDGYFGYWKTPMHFEYFLLDTLKRSGSLIDWKQKLNTEIQDIAGDDATLALMAFRFGTFKELKKNYIGRYKYLENRYILPLSESYTEAKAKALWQEDRRSYERYLD